MKDILTVMTNIEHCIDQLRKACEGLEEFGIHYHTASVYRDPASMLTTVYLSRGITEIALAFDKKVESAPTDSFGTLEVGDVRYLQGKLPVEREDRYA